MEQIPLTFSGQSQQYMQLVANTGFLSQVKQMVLKPKPNKTWLEKDSLKISRILSITPSLRELNIHVGVPLSCILRQGQLPTVRTLSVPINQVGPEYEATSVIRACPNVRLLRLNVTGKPVRTRNGDGVSRPECRRALEAAAELTSLRALELFRFGSNHRAVEMEGSAGIYSLKYFGPQDGENGWVPEDLKVIREYFPHISSLALYGNVGYNNSWNGHVKISDLLVECSGITNLSSLTMTTEPVHSWQWLGCDSGVSFQTLVWYEDINESIWSGAGHELKGAMYEAVGRAFEMCANLREMSFVYGAEGRTWTTVCADREARGQDAEAFKTQDFVNSKYAFGLTGTDHVKHRWF